MGDEGSVPEGEEDIEAVYEGEGRLDALGDRIYDDELVGRRVRAEFNDEGWSTGFITWFNTRLNEFRAEFQDGSEDYFKKDEIDGVEIILLPPDPEKDRKPGKPAAESNDKDDIEEKMKALHEGEEDEEDEEDDNKGEKEGKKEATKEETKKEESSSVKKDESKKEEVPKKEEEPADKKVPKEKEGKKEATK